MKHFINNLLTSVIILGGGIALNSNLCYSMDDLNPLSNPNTNDNNLSQINLKSENKNDNKINNILEWKMNFAEFKKVIKSFATIKYNNNNIEIDPKQIGLIKKLPEVVKALLKEEGATVNNNMYKCWRVMYLGSYSPINLDNIIIYTNSNSELFERFNNKAMFSKILEEKFNNNEHGVKEQYDKLGIKIDFSNLNSIDVVYNIIGRKEFFNHITEISYKFLMEFFLNYNCMRVIFDSEEEQYSAYKNFLTILKQCYYKNEINKDDYKLILRTILYNSIIDIDSYDANRGYNNTNDISNELQNTNNSFFSLNDVFRYYKESYNNNKLVINEVIKYLTRIEQNSLYDITNIITNEEKINRISKMILEETIMPCIKETILNKTRDNIKVNMEESLKSLINNPKVLKKFDKEFNVTENVTSIINLPRKDKLLKNFANYMGKGINNKIGGNKINSTYIIEYINSYTKDNRALKLAKYTKGK